MSRLILKRKNWEIFLAFIVAQFVGLPTILILSYLFGPGAQSLVVQLIEFIATITLYFSYPILIGLKLNGILAPQKNFKLTSTKFIMTSVIVMITSYIIRHPWGYLIPLIIIPCFITVAVWPARPLKSIELGRNAGIWEYIPYAFQFVLWPLGVWWIQPQLNVIDESKVRITE